MMSNLVALTFADTEQAGQAFKALKQAQHGGHLQIDDAAVVFKQESGKVEIKNQLETGVKRGVLGVGVLGYILGVEASVFKNGFLMPLTVDLTLFMGSFEETHGLVALIWGVPESARQT
jgi:uncharacterized membrane protein